MIFGIEEAALIVGLVKPVVYTQNPVARVAGVPVWCSRQLEGGRAGDLCRTRKARTSLANSGLTDAAM